MASAIQRKHLRTWLNTQLEDGKLPSFTDLAVYHGSKERGWELLEKDIGDEDTFRMHEKKIRDVEIRFQKLQAENDRLRKKRDQDEPVLVPPRTSSKPPVCEECQKDGKTLHHLPEFCWKLHPERKKADMEALRAKRSSGFTDGDSRYKTFATGYGSTRSGSRQ